MLLLPVVGLQFWALLFEIFFLFLAGCPLKSLLEESLLLILLLDWLESSRSCRIDVVGRGSAGVKDGLSSVRYSVNVSI